MDEYIEENGLYYRVKPDGSRQEVSQLYYEYGLQAQKERERVNQVEEKQEEPTLREKYENHPIVKSMLERGWDVHVNPGADEQKRLISEGYQQSSLVGVWVKRPKLKAVKAGDFYEFIGEANANPVSEHLGISKSKTAKGEVTVGIPYHAFERNKEKLRELGFEVEIGESGEDKPVKVNMERPKYSDGRLIPKEGDKVYQAVRGAFGSVAYINGIINSKGRVVVESSADQLGIGVGPKKGKTYSNDGTWTVVGDPEIKRKEEEKEKKIKESLEETQKIYEESERRRKESIKNAIKGGHKRVKDANVKVGDVVVLHWQGIPERHIVKEIDKEGRIYTTEESDTSGRAGGGYGNENYTVPIGARNVEIGESGEIKPFKMLLYRGMAEKPVDEGMYGKGTYFTSDSDYAAQYGNVEEKVVELAKPYRANAYTVSRLGDDARLQAVKEGKSVKEQNEIASQSVRDKLESQGYDGIIVEGSREVVAFYPKSIKIGTKKEREELRPPLTKLQYLKGVEDEYVTDQVKKGSKSTSEQILEDARKHTQLYQNLDDDYYDYITQWGKEGRPIPHEILNERPDLQAKYGSQKTATAQVESESKNVGQKYSWEMSKEERASEIERLKKENASILATPLMSEGSISPYQVGSMGKQQRARWEKNAMLRMDIESKIKELESDERIQSAKEMFYAKEEEEKSLKPYLWSKDKYLEMALTKKPQSLSYLSDKEYLKFEAKRHEKSVKAAIRNREEVPVEVLNDYPQLVGTQESISKEFGVKAEVNKDITSDPLEKNIIAKDKLPSGDIYEYRVAKNPTAESPKWKYQIQIKKQGGTEWDSAGMGYGKTPAEIMAKFGERYKLGKLEEVEAIDPIVKGSVQRRLQEIADKRVQEEEEKAREEADYKIRTERYQKAQEEIKNIKFHKMDVTIMLRTAEGDKPEIVKGKGYGGLAITTEGEGKYKKYKITHTQSGYSVGRGFNTETNAKMALYRLQQITDWDRASDIVTSELKNSGDIKYVAKVAADPYDFSGDWVEHKSPATRIVTEKPKREIKESISMVDFGGNKYEAPIVKTVERDGIKFAQTQSKLGMGKVNDIHYWDEKEGKWLYIEQGRLSKSQLPRIIENLKIIKGEEVAEVAETKKYPPTFEGLVERAKDEGDEKYAENVIVGSKNLTKAGKEKYLQQLKGEEPTNIFEKKKPTKAEYYNWRMGGDVETPYARFLQDVSKLETAEDKRIKSIEEALPPGKEYDYGKVNPVLRNKLVERAILAKEEGVIDDRELRDFIEQHPYIKNTADWREVVSKFKGKPIKVAEEPKEPVMTEQDYEDFIKPVVKKTVEPIPIPPTEPIQAPIPTSTPITTIKAEKPIKRRNRPRKAYQEYSTAVVTYQKPEAVPYNRPEIESYIPPELPSLYEPKTVVERVETVDGEFKEIPIEEAQPPKQESRNEEPSVEAAWREVKYRTAPEGEFRQTEGARAIPSKKETKKTGRVRNWEWVGSSSNEAEAKRFAEQFSKQSGRKTKYQAQYHGKDDEGNDMITYRVSAVAIGSGLDQKLKKRKPSQYRKIAKKVVEGIYKKGKKGVETTGRMIGNLTDVSGTIPKYIPPDMNIRVSGRVYEPFRYKPTHVEKMPEYGHYYRPYQPYRALNYRSVLYPTEVSRRKRRKKINRERVVEY